MNAITVNRANCPAPQHGEYWMATKYGCRCFDTKVAESEYRRAKRRGVRLVVDATAATRITQGLAFHGYIADRIAGMSGVSVRVVYALQSGQKTTIRQSRDRMLRDAADRVRLDEYRTGWDASRARSTARRNGWVPLTAWDDDTIGNPATEPDLGGHDADLIDEVAVRRALAGGKVRLSAAETVLAVKEAVGRGEPLTRVADRLGVNYAGAQQMLSGELTPRRAQQARVEAELLRIGDAYPDSTIAALLGVHHQTVTRARRRLAERQEQLAS